MMIMMIFMITGRAEEVVKRRKHELTRSLLAQTCTIKDQEDSKTYSQVIFQKNYLDTEPF